MPGRAFVPSTRGAPWGTPLRGSGPLVVPAPEDEVGDGAEEVDEGRQRPQALGASHVVDRSVSQVAQGHRLQGHLDRPTTDDERPLPVAQLAPLPPGHGHHPVARTCLWRDPPSGMPCWPWSFGPAGGGPGRDSLRWFVANCSTGLRQTVDTAAARGLDCPSAPV